MEAPNSRKKILIVTGDCPSHPYACAKLATVLNDHHDVTVAGPNGSALSRLQAQTKKYNESNTSKRNIGCRSIGDVSTLVHCNVRQVVDPHEYSPFRIVYNTIFNRDQYKPYGIANDFEQLMDDQVGTYENLKKILPDYDLVYAIHTAAGTAIDALESLRQEREGSAPPCIVFSSLPYNSGFFYKRLWTTPRSIVGLPHVATYSSPKKVLFEDSGFFLFRLVKCLIQIFWMALDTYHTERAWNIAGPRSDKRRAARGLPLVHDAMRYYWTNYPVLSVGGIEPYLAEGERVADNVTVVGSLRSTETSGLGRLEDWIDRTKGKRIVYASFGTGTQLNDEEATNLAKLALSLRDTEYCLLLSLSKSLQTSLRHIIDEVIGSEPNLTGDGFAEYTGGFRIDCDVPQENLLLSKRVQLFVSHMGFGGYIEAVNAGIPFVSYPSGCDQWYNAERAIEAGIATRANPRMKNLDITVRDALNNESLEKRSRQLASDAADFDSNQIILDMITDVCDGKPLPKRQSSTSTCSTDTSTSDSNDN